jgi:small subunit ribosomal protein S8
MYSDPISDYLTRIRNAMKAGHRVVEIPANNQKKAITKILLEKGYILNFKIEGEEKKPVIKIALKYNGATKQPAIKNIERVSSPGLRKYAGVDELPRVLNGLGIAIISTSKGILSDKEARKENLGGEVICYVY